MLVSRLVLEVFILRWQLAALLKNTRPQRLAFNMRNRNTQSRDKSNTIIFIDKLLAE